MVINRGPYGAVFFQLDIFGWQSWPKEKISVQLSANLIAIMSSWDLMIFMRFTVFAKRC